MGIVISIHIEVICIIFCVLFLLFGQRGRWGLGRRGVGRRGAGEPHGKGSLGPTVSILVFLPLPHPSS